MGDRNLVYSNPEVTSADGVIQLNHHTDSISFMSQSADFCDVKLNGKFVVRIGHGQVEAHFYNTIEGDFTTFQILTVGVTLAVFAVG
jgi:hypothetical protein